MCCLRQYPISLLFVLMVPRGVGAIQDGLSVAASGLCAQRPLATQVVLLLSTLAVLLSLALASVLVMPSLLRSMLMLSLALVTLGVAVLAIVLVLSLLLLLALMLSQAREMLGCAVA
jgi:hypothetical protein